MSPELQKILADDAGAMPEEVSALVTALLEGRVKQMLLIVELEDNKIMDMFKIIAPDSNRYSMLGAIEVVKRDYMREQTQARIEYQPIRG